MRNHCCNGKTISVTYSECAFVALGIQHAVRMHSIMLSSVVCPAVPYFPTLSRKWLNFRGGGEFLNTKRVLRFSEQILSETFLFLIRTERDMIKNVYWPSCKVLVMPVRF